MAFKSPFNYIGNKYRIIDEMKACFPQDIGCFVDLFCGGCDVTINVQAERRMANDLNYHLIDILRDFQQRDVPQLIQSIEKIISEHRLSKTDGEAFYAYRDYYNRQGTPLDLYVLMCYSFNFQFRFNANHAYNTPFGKNRSYFSDTMKQNLRRFVPLIRNVEFSSVDFLNFDYGFLGHRDFLYADPPYLLTCGSYNDGRRGFRGWTQEDDIRLMGILDQLNGQGTQFALSNVVEHKGIANDAVIQWVEAHGYHMHDMHVNYDNCNYHTRNNEHQTREVLITNY